MTVQRLSQDIQKSNQHLTIEQIKQYLKKCQIWHYEWGAIIAHDNDMHIHVFEHYRKKVYLRKPLREVAFFMFARYDVIKTSVLKTKPDALKFDLKIGWQLEKETPTAWHLTMKKEEFRDV